MFCTWMRRDAENFLFSLRKNVSIFRLFSPLCGNYSLLLSPFSCSPRGRRESRPLTFYRMKESINQVFIDYLPPLTSHIHHSNPIILCRLLLTPNFQYWIQNLFAICNLLFHKIIDEINRMLFTKFQTTLQNRKLKNKFPRPKSFKNFHPTWIL